MLREEAAVRESFEESRDEDGSKVHQKPNSAYLQLDTASNNDATKIEDQKLYMQFASFDDKLNPDGSANLYLREFFCCCGPCGRLDWENCENKDIVGTWKKRVISPKEPARDTSATGLEIDAFR